MLPRHPAVDAVTVALRAAGALGEVRWLDGAATTAAQAAAALDIEVGAIANSLIFTLDGEPLVVMTSGDHRVDTAWLGEQLGGLIGRADAAMVKAATGQVIGGVAPVGHPRPIRTIVDLDLARFGVVWAAAGHAHTVFPTSFTEIVAMTGGRALAVVPPVTLES